MDETVDVSQLGPHFTDSPLFIVAVVAAIIIIGIVVRLLFSGSHKEYEYKDDD